MHRVSTFIFTTIIGRPENHSLQTLVREKALPISELVKDLPVEKLSQLETIINDLRNAE